MSAKFKPIVNSYPAIRLAFKEGDANPGVQDVTRALTVLGCGTGCDIVLDSERVDHVHAAIVRLGQVAYVCDLGGAGGTRVNERFVRWERLNDGDELAVGPFVFDVEMEEARHTIVATTRPFSLRNDQTVGAIHSEDPVLLVGSDATCDIVLGGSVIAPRHVIVVWSCDGPIVRDLTGEASTRVNGKWIREAALHHGDAIGVGNYELIFEIGHAPAVEHSTNSRGQMPMDLAYPGPGHMIAGKVPTRPTEIPLKSIPEESTLPATFVARDYDHLNEEQASIEIVRAMDEMSRDRSDDVAFDLSDDRYQGTEPLNDSDVLELLEDVEEVDESIESAVSMPCKREGGNTGRRKAENCTDKQMQATPSQEIAAERLVAEYGENLNKCAPDLKARVIAAQNALDERARKLRDELDSERARLKVCQDQLQAQARRLLNAAKGAKPADAAAPNVVPTASAEATDKPNGKSNHRAQVLEECEDTWKDDMTTLERLFSGSIDLEAATQKNAGETHRTASSRPAENGNGKAEAHGLQYQVADLAQMVRQERDETRMSESRLESLKFEIERLRTDIVRSKEKHQKQYAEHEARYQTIQRSISAVKHERESLMVRLRRLDTKEAALSSRLAEAECVKKDLEHEAERLSRNQELHDDRVRELRVSLESERHRLRIRQTEMQKKAGELAKLAQTRRKAIEEIVNQQHEALKDQETEIKSKRSALIEAGRAELERTASELEQLLSVRLADVETELFARQETLEGWIHAIYDANKPVTHSAGPTKESVFRMPKAAVGLASSPVLNEDIGIMGESRHLAQLETELEGLHRAVVKLDDESDRKSMPLTETPAYSKFSEGPPEWSRPTRWGNGLTSRLSEKLSSLRSGIEEIAKTVESSRLSTDTSELEDKLDAAATGSIRWN